MTENTYRRPGDAAARLAELRAGGRSPAEPQILEAEEIAEETAESFSTLSADRQQKIMLELRRKDGNIQARPYSYLAGIDFDPSIGIRLDFTAYEVRIEGRNLRPLLSGLIAQRVAVVQEIDDLYAEATAPAEATVVTRIVVTERKQH